MQKIKAASELYIETEKKKREKAYLGEASCPPGPCGRAGPLELRVRLGGGRVPEKVEVGEEGSGVQDGGRQTPGARRRV